MPRWQRVPVPRAATNSLFLPQMYFNSIISDSTKLLKPILVFAFAIAAGICGLTQITQYRSHPADVYVGFLIGSGIAAYLVSAGPRPRGGRGGSGGKDARHGPRSPRLG